MRVEQSLVEAYRKGTQPDQIPTQADVDEIITLLKTTSEWLKEDFENGLFANYTPYTTSTGTTIKSVEDALSFNLFHEGLHLGVILSLQKLVSKDSPS